MLSRPPILAEPPPPPPHVCPDSPAAALPDPLPALPTSVAGNASLGLEGVEFLGALTCDTCLEIDTPGLPVSTRLENDLGRSGGAGVKANFELEG